MTEHNERNIERALRLLEQIEGYHAHEKGWIDPSDWDRFDCGDLLGVADGRFTLNDLVWGRVPDEEELAKHEQEKLAAWQEAATRAS